MPKYRQINLGGQYWLPPLVSSFTEWLGTSPEDRANAQMLEKIAKVKQAGIDLSKADPKLQRWVVTPSPSTYDKLFAAFGKEMPKAYTQTTLPEKKRELPQPPSSIDVGAQTRIPHPPKQYESYFFDKESTLPSAEDINSRVAFYEGQNIPKKQAQRLAFKEILKLDIPQTPQEKASESIDEVKAIVDLTHPTSSQDEKDEMTRYLLKMSGNLPPAQQREVERYTKEFIRLKAANPDKSFVEIVAMFPEEIQPRALQYLENLQRVIGVEEEQKSRQESRKQSEEDRRLTREDRLNARREGAFYRGQALSDKREREEERKREKVEKGVEKKVSDFFGRLEQSYENHVFKIKSNPKKYGLDEDNPTIPSRGEFWNSAEGMEYVNEYRKLTGKKPLPSLVGVEKEWNQLKRPPMRMPTRQEVVEEMLDREGHQTQPILPKVPTLTVKGGSGMRQRAIEELNKKGAPITENNIQFVIKELSK